MDAISKPIRVAYLHGRGSTAATNKATFLANVKAPSSDKPLFEVIAEDYDTRDLHAAIKWAEDFVSRTSADVLIGSSFGGAVAVNLLRSGAWKGPTLLLAQAYALYVGEDRVPAAGLPENRLITLVHGTEDSIVPISGSRALSRTGTDGLVTLIEIDGDEHRLETLTKHNSKIYVESITSLYEFSKAMSASLE